MFKATKRAQLKIQEMSFMLIALVLFFIIAGLFFLIITNTGIKESVEKSIEKKAEMTIENIAKTPEFYCGAGEQTCIDTDKIIMLKNAPEFKDYWDVGGLVIKKVYPIEEANREVECAPGNYYTGCGKFTIKAPDASQGYNEIYSYVSLCRKELKAGYVYDKCELGIISVYTK